MPTICIAEDTSIDSHVMSGRPWRVEISGKVWLDERDGIAIDGWQKALADLVSEYGLNKPEDGFYYRSVALWLDEHGLLSLAGESSRADSADPSTQTASMD